ncbi:hypothetical protein [uncultured Ruegeria sp.]|uniref:hypothetical protein n=1 Tax=uncultured Ruegeria sp. TaxID=259304 RepID=UPI002624752B|nr:hypothetical protein [uncultured Ruegeria sp.]
MNDEANARHRENAGEAELSDQEIEARVFRELEAKQREWDSDHDAATVIFQYPDNRTLFQRIAAWWHLQRQSRNQKREDVGVETGSEPE